MSPLLSWALLTVIVAVVVLVCVAAWPSGREDRATFVYHPVEAQRTSLTACQRRARRRSLDRATRQGGAA